MNKMNIIVVAGAIFLSFFAPANAAVWKISFIGTITDDSGRQNSFLSAGDNFSGFFIFDETTPALPVVNGQSYELTAGGLSIPSISADFIMRSTPTVPRIIVRNDVQGADSFAAPIALETDDPDKIAAFTVSGTDTDGDFLSDTSLGGLASALFDVGITGLEETIIVLTFGGEDIWGNCNSSAPCQFFASLDTLSIELTEVPVPASLFFFFSGIFGLSFIRRKKTNVVRIK